MEESRRARREFEKGFVQHHNGIPIRQAAVAKQVTLTPICIRLEYATDLCAHIIYISN